MPWGTAIWKSASHVVFVEGTNRPIRLRELICDLLKRPGRRRGQERPKCAAPNDSRWLACETPAGCVRDWTPVAARDDGERARDRVGGTKSNWPRCHVVAIAMGARGLSRALRTIGELPHVST